MTKNIGILIFDDAEVLDFAGPFELFSVTSQLNDHKTFNVFTLAKEQRIVIAVNGLKIHPDYSFDDHPAIDILIIAGGQGTRKLLTDTEFLQWVKKIHNTTELTLSICSASRVLGALGLLDHKPYCTHHQVYDHMLEIAPLGSPQKINDSFNQTSAFILQVESQQVSTSHFISLSISLGKIPPGIQQSIWNTITNHK